MNVGHELTEARCPTAAHTAPPREAPSEARGAAQDGTIARVLCGETGKIQCFYVVQWRCDLFDQQQMAVEWDLDGKNGEFIRIYGDLMG